MRELRAVSQIARTDPQAHRAPSLSSGSSEDRRGVVETLHGRSVRDPYRWLEDEGSEETQRWLSDRDDEVERYFRAVPGFDQTREQVERRLSTTTVDNLYRVGSLLFYRRRGPLDDQGSFWLDNGQSKECLIDPKLLGFGPETSIDLISVSPDASKLAYGVRHGGHDRHTTHLFDVGRRCPLSDQPRVGHADRFAFSRDSKGYYTAERHGESWRIVRHDIGAPNTREAIIAEFEAGGTDGISITDTGGPDALNVLIRYPGGRSSSFYLVAIDSGNVATLIYRPVEKNTYCFPIYSSQCIYAVTDVSAPNGRVVEIDPANPQVSSWREVVAETDQLIRQAVYIRHGRMLVTYRRHQRVEGILCDLSGERREPLSLPTSGTVVFLPHTQSERDICYTFTDFTTPTTVRRYTFPRDSAAKVVRTGNTRPSSTATRVRDARCTSRDGTSIPVQLVSAGTAKCRPTILTAYGGRGTAVLPRFNVFTSLLLAAGYNYAIANVRGGGEFGKAWYRAGIREKRQNSVDDFVAAARWLIKQQYTTEDTLAAVGSSNGTLLVGAAITQHPTLFRAAVCIGPLFDLLRYDRFLEDNTLTGELGSPWDEDEFDHLFKLSPYHSVTSGARYPALLVVSGSRDTRCHPMHARKMVARLQGATGSHRSILLEHDAFRGHIPNSRRAARITSLTRRLVFLFNELQAPKPHLGENACE